jgi:hypothetical protein
MKEYTFTLIFDLKDSQADPSDFIEKLYEGGCDDALIGVGNKGYIALNFIREASTYTEAINSAVEDVKRVIPAANLRIEDSVIENINSNRVTTVEVEIDANEEVDKAIRCWKFIKDSIQSKFEKNLLSPNVVLNTEDLDCVDLALVWETSSHYLNIRVIEGRRESVYVYYLDKDSKEKLERWYQIEEVTPDWLENKLLLFTE